MNMNTKEMVIEKAEKMAAFLKDAESLPSMKVFRAEQAAVLLATRTEAAAKIEVLKKEQAEVIPKLIEARDAKEMKRKEAKVALDTAGREFNTAWIAVSSGSQFFNSAINGQEQILIESSDPALDEAGNFFTEKLSWLREPERISTTRLGAVRNILTETKIMTVETNYDAIAVALRYCMDAVAELQRMKLDPALDVEKIERMKAGIPSVDIFSDFTAEKPLPGSRGTPLIRPRFGGAASDEYEQTLIGRVIKKANDLLSKPVEPPLAKKRGATGAEATLETYKKRGAGYPSASGTYNYRADKA